MEPYIVFYILAFCITFFININGMKFAKKKKYISYSIFGMLTLLMAIRRDDMGTDLAGYLPGFTFINNNSLIDILEMNGYKNYEYGYILFNKFIGTIFNNEQFLIASCAIVSILSIGFVTSKLSTNPFCSLLVYMTLPSFQLCFSGLRQAIAIGICFVAFHYLTINMKKRFVLLVLLASTFHQTAIVFLFVYPLYKLSIGTLLRVFSFLIIPGIYLLREPIFLRLGGLFQDNLQLYEAGAYNLFFYFIFIYAILASLEKSINDSSYSGMLNIFYMACMIQLFGLVHPFATRLGYYFMPVLALLIPNAVSKCYDTRPASRLLLNSISSLFFIGIGLYFIYNSGYAMAYPYYFFWE